MVGTPPMTRAPVGLDRVQHSGGLGSAILRVADGPLYSDLVADRASGMGRAVIAIEALLHGLGLLHRTSVTAGLREP
jgi:hypothetical protein